MKKLLSVLLICLFAASLFACVDPDNSQNEDSEEFMTSSTAMCWAYDTIIRDSDGIDKCFWEDGVAFWRYFDGKNIPKTPKSAILALDTEYDMYLCAGGKREMELSNTEFYFPTEFEYDETKIYIKVNPDNANHFIITILQPCDQEEVDIILKQFHFELNENGERTMIHESFPVTITISTEA